jgi:hypothetical protein
LYFLEKTFIFQIYPSKDTILNGDFIFTIKLNFDATFCQFSGFITKMFILPYLAIKNLSLHISDGQFNTNTGAFSIF